MTTNLNNEITRATNAEVANTTAITNESTLARAAEEANANAITAETNRATAAENTLTTNLNTEITDRINAIANLQTQITNLLSNTDETALNSLAELVADYTANGANITSNLNAEISTRQSERAAADARLNALEIAVANLQGQ